MPAKTSNHYYIGLGSNLSGEYGSSFQILQKALKQIATHPEIKLLKCSSCYLSSPIGPQNQNNYHNAVALIESGLTPMQLLDELQHIESLFGRDRAKEQHWGARTLDLDMLLMGMSTIDEERLNIPHRELEKRSFVLIPLYEISPELTLPSGKNLKSLAENCDQTGIIERINKPLWP